MYSKKVESLQEIINNNQNKIMQEKKDNKIEIKVEKYKLINKTAKSNQEPETKHIWQIEIPKIDLIAPIEEGTNKEVMNKYVGHFENTEKWNGNIGLAAHNRRICSKLFCKFKRIKNW